MSLSESLGAGDTEAPAELVVPDYGAPAVSADKGPTSMGSEPAPAPAAAASGTAGGLAGLCDAVLAPLPKLITVHPDAGATDAAGAAESARLQTNLYNITGYRTYANARPRLLSTLGAAHLHSRALRAARVVLPRAPLLADAAPARSAQ